jgi:hypothetical protein
MRAQKRRKQYAWIKQCGLWVCKEWNAQECVIRPKWEAPFLPRAHQFLSDRVMVVTDVACEGAVFTQQKAAPRKRDHEQV